MQRVKKLLFWRGMLGSAMLAAFFTISTSPAAIACIVSSGTNTPALVAPELFGGSSQGLSPELSVPTESHSARSFVGLWYGTVSADGSLYAGFETFHSDGTEILVDNSAPATDNVCLGVWEQTAVSTIRLRHPSWYFDLNGNLLGTVVLVETLTLSADGKSYGGKGTALTYDTNGNQVGRPFEFQVKGTRINP